MKATHSLITNSSLSHYIIISTEKNFSNPIKINLETEIDLHLLFNKTTTHCASATISFEISLQEPNGTLSKTCELNKLSHKRSI